MSENIEKRNSHHKDYAKYVWKPPKGFKGDSVLFVDRYKNTQIGQITHVETSYSCKGIAYHKYSVHVAGYKRHRIIGDKSIIEVGRPIKPNKVVE